MQFFVVFVWWLWLQMSFAAPGNEESPYFWNNLAKKELLKNLNLKENTNVAKNIIVFIGDGMGVSTVTAARIYKGQMNGESGEETILKFEEFPNVALSKTYTIDRQGADSAATATAILAGVKTKYYTVGLNGEAVYGNCDASKGKEIPSMLHLAKQAGKSTGIVTTSRLTHATPGSAFAHSPSRDWEGDVSLMNLSREMSPGDCKDIAYQFVFENGRHVDVALAGGRRYFIPESEPDPETKFTNKAKQRRDSLNLIEEWKLIQQKEKQRYKYVWNKGQFDAIDADKTDKILGLFGSSHMQYELERDDSPLGEPSLPEMVTKTIKILQRNPDGFFLLVEGARIDHGHHDSLAKKALHETVMMDEAVGEAVRLTSSTDTLIIVTSDHSHAFTVTGYSKRGNDILGITNPIYPSDYPLDNKPFTTLLYSNGRGFSVPRKDPRNQYTNGNNFVFASGVPLDSETHGSEDVAIYASGPMGHLIRGVQEQSYIGHVMAYAACLGEYRGRCKDIANSSTSVTTTISNYWTIICTLILCFIVNV